MEDIQQILRENVLLKEQLLLKEEQLERKDKLIKSREEQLKQKNELIKYSEEQLEQKNELIKYSEEQLERKDELIKHNEEQLERKNERILYLERQLFGRRSEKRLPDYPEAQLTLFDADQGTQTLEQETPTLTSLVEDIKQKAEKRHNTQKEQSVTQKRSYRIPTDIERKETIINPENVEIDGMIRIGEDITERLMLDKAKFWVERIVRPLYKLPQEQQATSTTILQAPLNPGILPGCMAGESLLSQIIVDKFLYHIPEYRQAVRFKELGVDITTSSINRWVHAIADKLYPLYLSQMERVLSTNYIQVDETSHSVTDRPGSARKAYIWVVRSVMSPGIFFHYDKGSRSQEVILKLLKDYRGALQTDGYAAYSIYEEKQGVLPLGCLAHVRRKFENALVTTPQAQKALDYIALLYMLEGNLKAEGADYEQIRKEREQKAYPILQQMEKWMKQTCNDCTPKSPLGKAISYAFGMWPRISRYCKEGYYHIDNNGVENAIRPITLGRKNYLFSGNNNGAEDNCTFYTLLGSCLQAGVEPHQWLTGTLKKIPSLESPIDWDLLLPEKNASKKIDLE